MLLLLLLLLFSCQFVVRDSGDYSVHITESDLLVEWNNIEQVVGTSLCMISIHVQVFHYHEQVSYMLNRVYLKCAVQVVFLSFISPNAIYTMAHLVIRVFLLSSEAVLSRDILLPCVSVRTHGW